jgi:superfamily I DNA/RNA helicase
MRSCWFRAVELTLDPPDVICAESGAPHLDEVYLVLSTIHSAKGQEWDAVFILNVVDRCIPFNELFAPSRVCGESEPSSPSALIVFPNKKNLP